MSDPTALAAVTATLKRLLDARLPEFIGGKTVRITTDPPHRFSAADPNVDQVRLNLFLYQVVPNAALRNQPPAHRGPGVSAALAPLALDAYYLLTAYATGEDTDVVESQQLLGRALAALHDVPVLGANAIRLTADGLPLDFYGERVRVVPYPLSVDELSKLWSTFQTPYRLSAAVQASVVIIDSGAAAAPAPPVLSRGEPKPAGDGDEGVAAAAGLGPVYPTLLAIDLAAPPEDPARKIRPPGIAVFEPGEKVRLGGAKLRPGPAVTVVLTPPFGGDPVVLVAPDGGGADDRVEVTLRAAAASPQPLRAGLYAAAVRVPTGVAANPLRVTNELPLMVAPKISTIVASLPAVNGAIPADSTLTVTFDPPVRDRQRVVLLVGAAAVEPNALADGATALDFDLSAADLRVGRTYPVRLRVDGVDSFPTTPAKPLEFAHTVTIR